MTAIISVRRSRARRIGRWHVAACRRVSALQKSAQRFRPDQRRLTGGARAGDDGRLKSTMPAKRPCASTAAAPEKPSFGAGSRPCALRCARTRHRAVAGLRQRIGDADKGEIIAGAALAGERRGQKVSRAVKAQQREIVGLVRGDAFGMAKTRNGDGLAVVRDLRRRDQMSLAGHHDGGAVFDAAP